MEVADDSKKGDQGGDSPNMGAGAAEIGGKKGINFEKITTVIIGLKTYEANITDQKLKTYIQWSRSDKNPDVGIWKFIWAITLLAINIVGKQIKNDYIEEYQFRKVVETFFKMEPDIYNSDH